MKWIPLLIGFSLLGQAALAHEEHEAETPPSMQQQAQDDWREIRETAGEVKDATVNWGKSVGQKAKVLGQEAADVAVDLGKKAKNKAVELRDKAREAAAEKPAEDPPEEPAGNRFFY